MQTGEDTQGLRKIIDFTRLISIFILAIHFYIFCYRAFEQWHWTAAITSIPLNGFIKLIQLFLILPFRRYLAGRFLVAKAVHLKGLKRTAKKQKTL